MMRCNECKKKIIIHFTCKCSKLFCIKHYYFLNHNCEFKENLFKIEIIKPQCKINII